MAKIGLWSDAVNFPSIPLMKLSSYYKNPTRYPNQRFGTGPGNLETSGYKSSGHNVKLIDDFSERFDIAYCSKTFNLPAIKKIPQITKLPLADEIHLGGTGFAITDTGGRECYHKNKDAPLPAEIEYIYPDYGQIGRAHV